MPKTRPPHAPEFRRQMVDLVRAGRDPAELARGFEPSAQAIRNWVAQADRDEGRRAERSEVLTSAEGATALTRMPSAAQAIASDLVSRTAAALLAP